MKKITLTNGLELSLIAIHNIGKGNSYALRDAKGNGYVTHRIAGTDKLGICKTSFATKSGIRKAIHKPHAITGIFVNEADLI